MKIAPRTLRRRVCALLAATALVLSGASPKGFGAFAAEVAPQTKLLIQTLGLANNDRALQALTRVTGRDFSRQGPLFAGSSAEQEVTKVGELIESRALELLVQALSAPQDPNPEEMMALEKLRSGLADIRAILPLVPEERRMEVLEAYSAVDYNLSLTRLRNEINAILSRRELSGSGGLDKADLDASADALVEPRHARNAFDEHLSEKARVWEAVRQSPNLGRIERPLVRYVLSRRIKRLAKTREGLAVAREPLEYAFSRMAEGKPLTSVQRGLLEGLRPYVPGVNPHRAISSPDFDDYSLGGRTTLGWAGRFHDSEAASAGAGFITIASHMGGFHWLRVAIHEGFHQGDAGYSRGRKALQLLLAGAGQGLGSMGGVLGSMGRGHTVAAMLIEGYTEWRALQATMKILCDGAAGANPFSQLVLRLARKAFKAGDIADLEAQVRRMHDAHPYARFVKMAAAIEEKPGGRQALDDFVAKGDIWGLENALGAGVLESWGALAGVHAGVFEEQNFRAAGFVEWIEFRILDVIVGKIADRALVERYAERVRLLAPQMIELLNQSWAKQRSLMASRAKQGLEHYLDPALSHEAAVREFRTDLVKARAGWHPSVGRRFLIVLLAAVCLGGTLHAARIIAPAYSYAVAAQVAFITSELINAWRACFRLKSRLKELMDYPK